MKQIYISRYVQIFVLDVQIIFFNSCIKKNDIPEIAFNPSITYGNLTDQEGNIYKTVTVGTQVWMAENLKTTKYNNGVLIPNITENNAWIGLTTGAYCIHDNDSKNSKIYGCLYNWYAVNSGKLCPAGWHVPTKDEWDTLHDSNNLMYGMSETDGGVLKETGFLHWWSPNACSTNRCGFTALPGGSRNMGGEYWGFGQWGFWWTSTEFELNSSESYWRSMGNQVCYVGKDWGSKICGFSVRCVKDN